MRFRNSNNRRQPVTLDITPLVDVVFLLLIFFMVTTTFSRNQEINLDLPQAQTGQNAKEDVERIIVTIDATGGFTIQGEKVTVRHLKERLTAAAGGALDPLVSVQADQAASHGRVILVLDAARSLGMTRLVIASEPGQGGLE